MCQCWACEQLTNVGSLVVIQEHGIMIFDKKNMIVTTSVDFLSMKIQDGHYQPGSHIVYELLHFLESNFTRKQVQ